MKISAKLLLHRWKLIALVITLLASLPNTWAGGNKEGRKKPPNLAPANDLITKWQRYAKQIDTKPEIATKVHRSLSSMDRKNLAYLIVNVSPETVGHIFSHLARDRDPDFIATVRRQVSRLDSEKKINWDTLITTAYANLAPQTSSDEEMSSSEDEQTAQDTSSPGYTRTSQVLAAPPGGQRHSGTSTDSGSSGDSGPDESSTPMDTSYVYQEYQQHAASAQLGPPKPRPRKLRTQPGGNTAAAQVIIQQHHHHLHTGVLPAAAVVAAPHKVLAKKTTKAKKGASALYKLPFVSTISLDSPAYIDNAVERQQTIESFLFACDDILQIMSEIGREISGDMSQNTVNALVNLNIASLVDMVTAATNLNLIKMVPIFTLYDEKKPFTSIRNQLRKFQQILIGSGSFEHLGDHINSLIPLLLIQQERIACQSGQNNPNIEVLRRLTKNIKQGDQDAWTYTYQLLNQLNLKPKHVDLGLHYRGAENVLANIGLPRIEFDEPDDVAQAVADSVNESRKAAKLPPIDPSQISAAKYSTLLDRMDGLGIKNPNLEAIIAILKMRSTIEVPEQGEYNQGQLADLDQFAPDPPEKKFRTAFKGAVKRMPQEEHKKVAALVHVLLRRSQFLPPELMDLYAKAHPSGGAEAALSSHLYAAAGGKYDEGGPLVHHILSAEQRHRRAPVGMAPFHPPATTHTPVSQPGMLTVHNLPEIMQQLDDVTSEWHTLGIQLRIPNGTLNGLEIQYMARPKECLRETLSLWLNGQTDTPSWETLIQALDDIQHRSTAYAIREYVAEQSSNAKIFQKAPTLLKISSMKTPEGRPLHVIRTIAASDINGFGIELLRDDNGLAVAAILKDHRYVGGEECVTAIIQKWLNGGGPTTTWNHFLDALDAIRAGRLLEELKLAIPAQEAKSRRY